MKQNKTNETKYNIKTDLCRLSVGIRVHATTITPNVLPSWNIQMDKIRTRPWARKNEKAESKLCKTSSSMKVMGMDRMGFSSPIDTIHTASTQLQIKNKPSNDRLIAGE